jgi:Plant transposon protein
MGNNSSSRSFIPHSALECFADDGSFDVQKYYLYLRNRNLQNDDTSEELDDLLMNCLYEADQQIISLPKRTRKLKRSINLMMKPDGSFHELEPRNTCWYITYVVSPNVDDEKFQNKFRRRFRCSFVCYSKLLVMVLADPIFIRWQNCDASGRLSSPIQLCLLGSLRYLGRGSTFDDLEESTSISEETHRRFFHCFIYWGSTVLYNTYVKFPRNAIQCKDVSIDTDAAGFHGCVGSTDATHITMMRCPVSRANEHRGPKECLPARTYNITVNHRRQILNTTKGHPSRWNDKTLTHYDEFIKLIKEGNILADNKFTLYKRSDNNTVIEENYSGCWLMCDNGYLNWSCLMSPIKEPVLRKEKRWSMWMESMRKDVECTFGILKGRFRILKTGMRIHSIKSVDHVWCTCCALHNMFLDSDGLNKNWEKGVVSEWEGEWGELENGEQDQSGMGPGNDVENGIEIEEDVFDEDVQEICHSVNRINNKVFKQKLIEHFDILFERKEITWPTRNRNKEVTI